MLDQARITGKADDGRPLEERYAYYRRCRVMRRNGEQCKAPAEKGEHTCYKHAEQRETARRRHGERRAVLGLAVEMTRRAGVPISHPAELFMSFNGIQRVIAAAAQALIEGRIDCKTAGRLAVELQWAAKLLRVQEVYRKGRDGRVGSSGHRVIGSSEHRDIGTSEYRDIGTSANRESGTPAPWSMAALQHRCSAVRGRGRRKMDRREQRRLVFWNMGIDVRSRSPGMVEDHLRRRGRPSASSGQALRSILGTRRW